MDVLIIGGGSSRLMLAPARGPGRQGRGCAIMPAAAAALEKALGLLKLLQLKPPRQLARYRRRTQASPRREADLAALAEVLRGSTAARPATEPAEALVGKA